jgi:polysaccharide biosynthesis transport protein
MNLAGQFSSFTPAVDNGSSAVVSPLLQVRGFLTRQWRLIGLVTILAITLDVAYLAITPSRYTAQADMIIDTKRVTWTQSELATENRMVEDASVESEIETTKSEQVVLSVARRLHLDEDAEFVGAGTSLRGRIFSLLRLSSGSESSVSKEELLRRSLATLKENLRVMRLGRSYIEQIQ